MNRKLLLRITIPSVIIGLFLFTACLISIRYIHQLQTSLAEILAQNVTSLQAAQELEIQVRQLRFHAVLYFLNPKTERFDRIETDQIRFETAMDKARRVSTSEDEKKLLDRIEAAYQKYRQGQDQLIKEAKGRPLPEVYNVADQHPIRLVIAPCQELLKLNLDRMTASAAQSQSTGREAFWLMLFMGLAGPLGGVIVGFGITRGLRRSIYQLSVRVQDLAQHLDRDMGSVSVVADGDLQALDEKMAVVVQRVEQAAKQLQQQQRELLRTEQMSQVGQLAAGVAHEIRNPLTGIKLLAEAALRPQAPRPFLNLEDTQMILREVKRLEQTVQQFLNFGRLPAPQVAPCDLREIVRQAWEFVKVRARQQHVEPTFHLPDDTVVVSADAGQLNTVFVNLFLNALDAMGTAGRIEVADRAANGAIHLTISDTGPGIPPEIQTRLFEPFATTKPHGTGLGLFLTGRILHEHGGAIRADNRPEGGACFTITLPAHADGGNNP